MPNDTDALEKRTLENASTIPHTRPFGPAPPPLPPARDVSGLLFQERAHLQLALDDGSTSAVELRRMARNVRSLERTQKRENGRWIFKGLRPPAADPQQNEGMMLRGYENHEAIALVTCAS